jgi:hypothetical protein
MRRSLVMCAVVLALAGSRTASAGACKECISDSCADACKNHGGNTECRSITVCSGGYCRSSCELDPYGSGQSCTGTKDCGNDPYCDEESGWCEDNEHAFLTPGSAAGGPRRIYACVVPNGAPGARWVTVALRELTD